MNRSTKLRTSFLALAILCATAFSSAISPARAADNSSFDPRQVEQAITEFYSVSQDPSLSGADREELADALADEITILRPIYYNSVIGLLVQEYRQEADHRQMIEGLIEHVQSKVQPELDRVSQRHPVITVVDDVFRVWSAVYVVGMSQGLWESRASGLKGIERFREAVTRVTQSIPSRRRAALLAVGIGTPVGIAHAIYQHLETRRIDPTRLLREEQKDIVSSIRAALAKHQAERGARQLTASRARALGQELDRDEAELAYLAQHAPWLRPQARSAMDAVNELRKRVI
jgi:hypothetical protein